MAKLKVLTKHAINITETLSKTITVLASSEEEALQKVRCMYQEGEVVLNSEDSLGTDFLPDEYYEEN
jgi:hypothetical protein